MVLCYGKYIQHFHSKGGLSFYICILSDVSCCFLVQLFTRPHYNRSLIFSLLTLKDFSVFQKLLALLTNSFVRSTNHHTSNLSCFSVSRVQVLCELEAEKEFQRNPVILFEDQSSQKFSARCSTSDFILVSRSKEGLAFSSSVSNASSDIDRSLE